MLEQYCPTRMASLFSDRARLARWWEVELAALEAQEATGHAPPGTAAVARSRLTEIDDDLLRQVGERRKVTGHEMAAFVDVLCGRLGAAGRWIHFGLTSADVIDTGNSILLLRASDLLEESLARLEEVLARRARELANAVMIGRTHGMHAEPLTFGTTLAIWAARAERDRTRLSSARDRFGVGNLSGPVGNYLNVDPRVEEHACAALGLRRAVNAQFVSRDRYAEYVFACVCIGNTTEAICTQLRLLHASEIGEVQEWFGPDRKGSSSMPHKKNPSVSMELTGLSRVLRSYLMASLESTAVWQEGDTTALAVERVVLPDVSNLTLYLLDQVTALVKHLVVDAATMRRHLDEAGTLPFSSSLMHRLIEAGAERDQAYRLVQTAASRARAEGLTLQDALPSEALEMLQGDADAGVFGVERVLRHVEIAVPAIPEEGT